MTTEGIGVSWLFLAFVLLILALLFWFISLKNRAAAGLPEGKIIYSDDGSWIPLNEPLYSGDFNLVGRPDYLVNRTDGTIIPVEIKSSLAPVEPWEGHVLQLAAYCLLVKENFGIRPPFGILQYQDQAYAVEYNFELEEELLVLLEDMQEDAIEIELDRNHDDWFRCEGCHFNQNCHQSLA